MREEYERDLHHAWMILETDELYKEDYQMRMLMENAIPGLLSGRGSAAVHTAGKLTLNEEQEVEIAVSAYEASLNLQIWKNL